jgi:hypothetical protein
VIIAEKPSESSEVNLAQNEKNGLEVKNAVDLGGIDQFNRLTLVNNMHTKFAMEIKI